MTVSFVKAHEVRKNGPLALIVPVEFRRKLNIEKGKAYVATTEGKNIVYTPIPEKISREAENEDASS